MPRTKTPRVLDPEDALTPDEAAELAQVTVRTIKRWVAREYLTRYQARANLLRVSKTELEAFLVGKRVQT